MLLVTGANGFVGTALCRALLGKGHPIRGAVRRADGIPASLVPPDRLIAVREIGPETDWVSACAGVDCVIHLAARTHVLHETAADALAEYRRVNVEGTGALARTAARCGVRRLVFMSSIKVNGESTDRHPFTESDPPRPEDAYGISKWEAEQVLRQIAAETGLEAVVLRPPLVYGPGVKGNLLQLLNAIARGVPLPLASIRNRRSLIALDNLVDAILACVESPAACGKTYLVSDGEDVSTPELVRMLAHALGAPPRLLPCPPLLLRIAGALTGKAGAVSRLTGSLQIDSSRIRSELDWKPRRSLSAGLAEMARWYHAQSGSPPSS